MGRLPLPTTLAIELATIAQDLAPHTLDALIRLAPLLNELPEITQERLVAFIASFVLARGREGPS